MTLQLTHDNQTWLFHTECEDGELTHPVFDRMEAPAQHDELEPSEDDSL